MPEFKLIEKLLYKSEENGIDTEFILGNKILWVSQSMVEKFEQLQPIFQCISQI